MAIGPLQEYSGMRYTLRMYGYKLLLLVTRWRV